MLLFPKMSVTRKIFPKLPQIYFLNRISGDIPFYYLVFFYFFVFLFLFLFACLFFEIENIYSGTHLTMWAGK